ncbi:MAG TPA: 23S rRNA (uracil(1939)-C(5))-methyltransferase RlmD [Myxococcota bacterium]|nr:23S rRNA (uracil(1939)-C(5))-methyltransferase RlmD [Myxococcota bacterium]
MVEDAIRAGRRVTLEIDGFAAGGLGVGRLDGRAVFVPFTIPGESVTAKIVHIGRRKITAEAERIVRPSPDRIQPACPAFGRCGGCQLQHVAYHAQALLKRRLLLDALRSISGFEPESEPGIVSAPEPFAYRNRGQYPVARRGSRVVTGFYAPRSHRVVAVDRCLIHDPLVDEAVACVRAWATSKKVAVYDENRNTGWLRHVAARAGGGSGQVLVTLVVRDDRRQSWRDLLRRLRRRLPGLAGLTLNINGARTNVIFGRRERALWGGSTINERFMGLDLLLAPQSFFQVNSNQAQELFSLALDFLADADGPIVDAYCGVGVLALLLARLGHAAVGIESNPAAVRDARRAAEDNGVSRTTFHEGTVEKVLPQLVMEGFSPAAAILDPPRKGCAPEVLEALIDARVRKVAYISCHPGSLARDLSRLFEAGYVLERLVGVDMFPQTAHLEVFAGLKLVA